MYGQRKPIAQRTPLIISPPTTRIISPTYSRPRPLSSSVYIDSLTPAATEGETTETETELDTEVDDSYISPKLSGGAHTGIAATRLRSHSSTQHDLMNFFFRKDVIILRNIDLLRYALAPVGRRIFSHTLFIFLLSSASDVKLVLLLGYAIVMSFCLPSLHSSHSLLAFHFLHALAWRFIHSFALGLVLKAQSDSKFLVRHFITRYHYPGKDAGRDAVREAFNNWKSLYNLSLCMTYGMSMQLSDAIAQIFLGQRHLLVLRGRHTLSLLNGRSVTSYSGIHWGSSDHSISVRVYSAESYPRSLLDSTCGRQLNATMFLEYLVSLHVSPSNS